MEIKLNSEHFFERVLGVIAGESLPVVFTTWGGNLATIEGRLGSIPLLVLFTQRPLTGRGSASQTFLFAPAQHGIKRLMSLHRFLLFLGKIIMGYILIKDRRLIDELDFRDNLEKAHSRLAAFFRQGDRRKEFDARDPAPLQLADRREAL